MTEEVRRLGARYEGGITLRAKALWVMLLVSEGNASPNFTSRR